MISNLRAGSIVEAVDVSLFETKLESGTALDSHSEWLP